MAVPSLEGSTGPGHHTWTPKVCKTMAFWAVLNGFGPLFYILWQFGVQIEATSGRQMVGVGPFPYKVQE